MNTECDWLETRYEDLLSNEPSVLEAVEAHAASCPTCRKELEAQRHVGSLLEACFTARMEKVRAGAAASRLPALALVGAAAALLALGLWLGPGTLTPAPEPPVQVTLNDDDGSRVPDDLELEKPGDETPIDAAPIGSAPADTVREAGFSVMDQAGYVHTLADFSGRVLVLGVFGPETSTEDAAAFRELSDALASGEIRFLAVGLEAPPSGPFGNASVMVSRGSDLLGLGAGDFAVVTAGGEAFRTGSISDSGFAEAVRTSLTDLGAG